MGKKAERPTKRGRPKANLKISAGDRAHLKVMMQKFKNKTRLVQRCRIVLMSGNGLSNREVAHTLNISLHTVSKWRERFIRLGVGGLVDSSKVQGRDVLDDQVVSKIVNPLFKAMETDHYLPKRLRSIRSMEKKARISAATICRTLKSFGIVRQGGGIFHVCAHPEFIQSARLGGLYLSSSLTNGRPTARSLNDSFKGHLTRSLTRSALHLTICQQKVRSPMNIFALFLNPSRRSNTQLKEKKYYSISFGGMGWIYTGRCPRPMRKSFLDVYKYTQGRWRSVRKRSHGKTYRQFLNELMHDAPKASRCFLIVDGFEKFRIEPLQHWQQIYPGCEICLTPSRSVWCDLVLWWLEHFWAKHTDAKKLESHLNRFKQSTESTFMWTRKISK